jgi:hypothetical protein
MLLPSLEKFNPDLLFISAGFDAHFDDMYHFLTEDDLHWVTEQLCAVADRCGDYGATSGGSGARKAGSCAVVSVLEGGYSLSTPIPVSAATGAGAGKGHKSGRVAAATAAGVAGTGIGVGVAAVSATASVVPPAAEATAPTTSREVLGRGGRLKAKKDKAGGDASSATACVPPPVPVPVAVAAHALPPASVVPVHAPSHPQPLAITPAKPPAPAPSSGLEDRGEHAADACAAMHVVSSPATVTGTSAAPTAAAGPAAVGGIPMAAATLPANVSRPQQQPPSMHTMYAQRPGDGGLVKGYVLIDDAGAHPMCFNILYFIDFICYVFILR